ncbi:hypothetical protein QYF61_002424 [Mycteria americana]|uniref:Ragulator complex protein LAMTOR1 n=1 Tax=Mycteria americana TaxID=33587 RepID=A0AAN7S1X0_MYCAM|nr:hypothetical protein QYF61_002424 [Mycteria americana]
MGCCYSSEAEASDQEEETKRLLEPAASPPNKVLNGAEQSYPNLPSARTDEQAMLSSILAKTAINIIDVSAADSQGMEQHEYMDRARQYSTRLAMLSNNLTHWKKLPLLPSLTNQPHQVLASDPVPFADLQQVRGWGPALPRSRPPRRSAEVRGGRSVLVPEERRCREPWQLWQRPLQLVCSSPAVPEDPGRVPAAALAVFGSARPRQRSADATGRAGAPVSVEVGVPVSRIAAYAFSALSQIRVDAKEELVVQFGIP